MQTSIVNATFVNNAADYCPYFFFILGPVVIKPQKVKKIKDEVAFFLFVFFSFEILQLLKYGFFYLEILPLDHK